MNYPGRGTTKALIEGLVSATGAADPVAAIRLRATQAIDKFVRTFGEPDDMPLDLIALASFLGIRQSNSAPTFSPDAELAPDGGGGMEMRVNPDRPETRRRFSIGHEITHTFFPDHTSHVWPRANSRYRNLSDPDDYLEMLCDVGAAELVLPRRWFIHDSEGVATSAGVLNMAARYVASREATVRRFAELHSDPVASVFLAWKLKPTQRPTVGVPGQGSLFGTSPESERRNALRLRVEYAIPSASFSLLRIFIPRDKSFENTGPAYEAAVTGQPVDGAHFLELGEGRGTYQVCAIPVWTADEERGPCGENSVVAIIRPVDRCLTQRRQAGNDRSLFD